NDSTKKSKAKKRIEKGSDEPKKLKSKKEPLTKGEKEIEEIFRKAAYLA
ncbi:25524_t:CDS:1, partial [Gigaspora rosea]